MTSRLQKMVRPFKRFTSGEAAALSIEAAIMLPVLALLYVIGFGYFDAYRRESVITKATYAVGDFLSRQNGVVTPADIEGLQDLYGVLTFSEGENWLRVTEIRRDGDTLDIEWSYATDGNQEMTDARLEGFLNRVPTMLDGERVVAVESFTNYSPRLNIGLQDRTFERFITTRQRETACLAFDASVPPSPVSGGCGS